MKRIAIAFCLLLLLALPVHAQEYDYCAGAGGAAVVAFCTGGTGTTNADLLCESAECVSSCDGTNANCFNAWTTYKSGSNTVTYNQAQTGTLGCTDKGSYMVYVDKSDTNNTYASFNRTYTANDYQSFTFLWYFGATNVASGAAQTIFYVSSAGDTYRTMNIVLLNTSGTYNLKAGFYNKSYGTTVATSTGTVTPGNWYPIRATFQKNALAKVEVDFNNDGTYDETVINGTTTVNEFSPNYIRFGEPASITSTFRFGFDNIAIKSASGDAKSCSR